MARGDLFTTPHITYFDSATDAVRIMEEWTRNPERRSEVIEAMQSHMVASITTSRATLQDAIRTIRQNRSGAASSLDERERERERACLGKEWVACACEYRLTESYDFLI